MKAVGYVRVSTVGQVEDGCSLILQRDKIDAYAKLNDLELVDTVEDAGLSGKTLRNRPGIQRVLEMVAKREVEAVVIYKLDRLARNARESHLVVGWLSFSTALVCKGKAVQIGVALDLSLDVLNGLPTPLRLVPALVGRAVDDACTTAEIVLCRFYP